MIKKFKRKNPSGDKYSEIQALQFTGGTQDLLPLIKQMFDDKNQELEVEYYQDYGTHLARIIYEDEQISVPLGHWLIKGEGGVLDNLDDPFFSALFEPVESSTMRSEQEIKEYAEELRESINGWLKKIADNPLDAWEFAKHLHRNRAELDMLEWVLNDQDEKQRKFPEEPQLRVIEEDK